VGIFLGQWTIAWQLYQFDGNTRVLKEHYDGMKKMTDFFTRKTQDHILSIGLGDWAYINTKTPVPLTSTAYYYHFADIISKSSALLGKESDKKKYRKLADSIKVAFNTQFYNQKTGYYANGSQTAQSIALYFDLVPTKEKEKVVKQMLHAVTQADNHLDAGILGAKYLLHALATNGHSDVAYSIITTKSYPGWGYLAANGATTLWEHWKGAEAKGLSSLNHIMFGDVSNWFYQYIAGIRPDTNAPGFKHFFIEPKLTTSLEWAAANFESAYGTIKVAWKKQGDLLELNIEIPHNSSATLILPKGKLTGADIALTSKKEHTSGKMTFELKSGTYNLNIK
jgi:alpha-L-rhamnosidase